MAHNTPQKWSQIWKGNLDKQKVYWPDEDKVVQMKTRISENKTCDKENLGFYNVREFYYHNTPCATVKEADEPHLSTKDEKFWSQYMAGDLRITVFWIREQSRFSLLIHCSAVVAFNLQ